MFKIEMLDEIIERHKTPENLKYQDYAGDGVYVEYDGCSFWLRANHHTDALCTDKIYLEPETLSALNRIAQRLIELKKNE